MSLKLISSVSQITRRRLFFDAMVSIQGKLTENTKNNNIEQRRIKKKMKTKKSLFINRGVFFFTCSLLVVRNGLNEKEMCLIVDTKDKDEKKSTTFAI